MSLSVRNILIGILFLMSITLLEAQSLSKEGKINAKVAHEYLSNGDYFNALERYQIVEKTDGDNAGVLYSIAICYVNTFRAEKALPYLDKVKNSNKIKDPLINKYYGMSYHVDHQFDEAIKHFNMYLLNVKDEKEREKIKRYIAQCVYAKDLVAKPVKLNVSNLGSAVNTEFAEYNPVLSADERTLFFTSRRSNSTGGEEDERDNMYFEDIYTSIKNDKGEWSNTIHLPGAVNSNSHDASVGLSSDGQVMFVYKTENGGDVYASNLDGNTWAAPVSLNGGINSEYWEPCGSISSDGKVIIFVSDRPGGLGGTDLYISRLMEDGTYSKPSNLGNKINTSYNEFSPFIHNDGKSISFSSEGHKGMGGYDIFSVDFDLETGEAKGDVKNEGYPINSAGDEIFFVWSADNRRAYFSSSREGGFGDKDLYVLELPEAEAKLVVLTGSVLDCETKLPVAASINIVDNTNGKTFANHKSNSATGKYVVVLPAGKNYGIAIEANLYAFYSKNINIPDLKNFKEMKDEVCLQSVKVGTKLVLRNVFFDIDKSSLRKESEVELNKLVVIMQQNPTLTIEISGHTDSDGDDAHNLELSKARSKSVLDYLVTQSIDMSRMRYVGYGEMKPVVANTTPENKQLNRRTEIEFFK